MIRINLLPVKAAKKKTSGRNQLFALGAVALVGLGLNAAWWITTENELSEKKAAATKLDADIQQLERIIGEVHTITKDKKSLEDKLAVLAELKTGRTGPVRVLDAIATMLPPKVWITSLDQKSAFLGIRGGALSNEELADFLRSLKQSPFFKAPTLKKATQQSGDAGKFVEFEIHCEVSYSA